MGIGRKAKKVTGLSHEDSGSKMSSQGSASTLASQLTMDDTVVGTVAIEQPVAASYVEEQAIPLVDAVVADEAVKELLKMKNEEKESKKKTKEDKKEEKRLSKRKSSERRSRKKSVLEEMVESMHPPLKKKNGVAKNGALVAIYIHASVGGSLLGLLMGINFLSILLTKYKFPWSLYILVVWGSLFSAHFALTWSIMKGTNAGTEELDEMIMGFYNGIVWVLKSFSGIFLNDFNPFPENSRLARLYDYLMKGVEPDDY